MIVGQSPCVPSGVSVQQDQHREGRHRTPDVGDVDGQRAALAEVPERQGHRQRDQAGRWPGTRGEAQMLGRAGATPRSPRTSWRRWSARSRPAEAPMLSPPPSPYGPAPARAFARVLGPASRASAAAGAPSSSRSATTASSTQSTDAVSTCALKKLVHAVVDEVAEAAVADDRSRRWSARPSRPWRSAARPSARAAPAGVRPRTAAAPARTPCPGRPPAPPAGTAASPARMLRTRMVSEYSTRPVTTSGGGEPEDRQQQREHRQRRDRVEHRRQPEHRACRAAASGGPAAPAERRSAGRSPRTRR